MGWFCFNRLLLKYSGHEMQKQNKTFLIFFCLYCLPYFTPPRHGKCIQYNMFIYYFAFVHFSCLQVLSECQVSTQPTIVITLSIALLHHFSSQQQLSSVYLWSTNSTWYFLSILWPCSDTAHVVTRSHLTLPMSTPLVTAHSNNKQIYPIQSCTVRIDSLYRIWQWKCPVFPAGTVIWHMES